MSAEENEAIVGRFMEGFVIGGNPATVDEVVAPNFTFHVSGLPPGLPSGPDAWKRRRDILRTAFSDIEYAIEDILATEDKVVVRYRGGGTHGGTFAGIGPTQKVVTYTGIMLLRLQDGRIVEEWSEADLLGLLRQIGAVPTPGQTQA